MAYILFAEDDTTLRNAITLALKSEGYEVRACKDGAEALAAYAERHPDLMILDVMMPRKSGYDVCAEIRRNDDLLPVMFLTAKASEEDVVLGLGLGADDFIAKPVRLDVLLARIAVIVKWTKRVGPATTQSDTFMIGDVLIDATRFTVRKDGAPDISLTIRELGLLKAFAAHPREVLSRDALLDAVWGENYFTSSRTLDQHIVQIRRKLGSAGALIKTVRGVGYHLTSDAPAPSGGGRAVRRP